MRDERSYAGERPLMKCVYDFFGGRKMFVFFFCFININFMFGLVASKMISRDDFSTYGNMIFLFMSALVLGNVAAKFSGGNN